MHLPDACFAERRDENYEQSLVRYKWVQFRKTVTDWYKAFMKMMQTCESLHAYIGTDAMLLYNWPNHFSELEYFKRVVLDCWKKLQY